MSDVDQKRLLAILGAVEAVSKMEASGVRDKLLCVMADMLVIENNPAIVLDPNLPAPGVTRRGPFSFSVSGATLGAGSAIRSL